MKALLLIVAIFAQSTAEEQCALEASVPKDAASFMMRRAMCEHWGGEEAYDAERRREINRNVRELRCTQLDADEVRLYQAYARQPKVREALKAAEEFIDWPLCPVRNR